MAEEEYDIVIYWTDGLNPPRFLNLSGVEIVEEVLPDPDSE